MLEEQKGTQYGLRAVLAALVGVTLFLSGYYIGAHRAPAAMNVAGVTHVENATGTASQNGTNTQMLGSCADENGIDVPCLIDRDGVAAVHPEDAADFDQFWRAWNVINEKFVPTKQESASNQEKVWGAITGLANSLGDPYTYFLPPAEKKNFEDDVRGNFGGVGMQIGIKDGIVTVIAPLRGSPAERAGITAGDKVLRIDGATTTTMTMDTALSLIRGEIGKPVHLTLFRAGNEEPIEVTIIREVIQVPTIDTKMKDGVFVIALYGFPSTGADLFRQALRAFAESGTDKLVLDLRGNPGGYLEVAVDMASWFLPAGKIVVKEEEKGGGGDIYRSRGYNVFGDGFRMVVLVDGGSASAAEILAGALSQHGVATLVGTKTFGKGSVQELVPITDTTSLKLTVARWITPNGTNLSAGGLDPDVAVEITKEDVEKGEDPQLEKAIAIAKGLQ